MKIEAKSVADYIKQLPDDRRSAIKKLRTLIRKNLPKGFKEQLSYGMPGWVVPHSKYPDGYHCDLKMPLPFMSIASQKNFIAVYHMGIYSIPDLMSWFTEEYPKHCTRKLDMGKSCVRFKQIEEIPYDLIGELASKITPAEWVEFYQLSLRK